MYKKNLSVNIINYRALFDFIFDNPSKFSYDVFIKNEIDGFKFIKHNNLIYNLKSDVDFSFYNHLSGLYSNLLIRFENVWEVLFYSHFIRIPKNVVYNSDNFLNDNFISDDPKKTYVTFPIVEDVLDCLNFILGNNDFPPPDSVRLNFLIDNSGIVFTYEVDNIKEIDFTAVSLHDIVNDFLMYVEKLKKCLSSFYFDWNYYNLTFNSYDSNDVVIIAKNYGNDGYAGYAGGEDDFYAMYEFYNIDKRKYSTLSDLLIRSFDCDTVMSFFGYFTIFKYENERLIAHSSCYNSGTAIIAQIYPNSRWGIWTTSPQFGWNVLKDVNKKFNTDWYFNRLGSMFKTTRILPMSSEEMVFSTPFNLNFLIEYLEDEIGCGDREKRKIKKF